MMTLDRLLDKLDLPRVGDDSPVTGLNTLFQATDGELSFLTSQKHAKRLQDTKAKAVFVQEAYASEVPRNTHALVVDNPYLYLAYASAFFAHTIAKEKSAPRLGQDCFIDEGVFFGDNVTIGNRVTIMPGCYIGDNSVVEDGCILYPNVSVYHGCVIQKDVIIHAGSVIGSDGYGFASKSDGTHVKLYQNGNVVIEDNVEIGANCSVDRAVFNTTRIKRGTKLDNLIHIAHNCEVGENNFFAAQVGLSGSTSTGKNVMMGGQAGTAGHLHITDHSVIAARGGVTKDVTKPGYYSGFPLMEGKLWLKLQAKLSRLLKN
ncbi:MAG: UDP-3-O-(3-hydroxymyristoyl)glucosamine N-acyltransferase [Campylobacterota bacterium]